jgi:exosome complex component RRP41
MAAFSVEDRMRPGPSRRSTEISKVSGEAFEPVIMTRYYPGAVIDVFAEILQADAGTRTAAINAASLALADAGIPMKSLIAACAVGKVDGQLVLDLNKPEDNYGDADLPVAMTPNGEITLLQMDGNLTPEEFKQALEMVKKGCEQIFDIQREVLMDRYGEAPGDMTDISTEDKAEAEPPEEEEEAAPVEENNDGDVKEEIQKPSESEEEAEEGEELEKPASDEEPEEDDDEQ